MNTVSIIIPCRNEEKYISKCLDSIINLDYPLNLLQVIVCDGESDDNTINIVRSYIEKYDFIQLINNEKRIAPTALNLGLAIAKGKFITRVDAHAEVNPDFLKKCINEFENNNELGCVGGILENIYENNKSKIISFAMSSSFGVGNSHFRTGTRDGYVDTLAFGTYKKEVFDKVGLFDEELVRNQDDEFNYRVTKANYKILLKRDITSKYYVRASYKKLFNQYFQYGYWKVYVNKKHLQITTIRQLVPMLFVLFLILGLIGSFFSNYIFKAYLFILMSYFLLAFISAFNKSKLIKEIVLIVYTFLILHISYGFGYLQGILDFILLNKKPSEKHSKLSR